MLVGSIKGNLTQGPGAGTVGIPCHPVGAEWILSQLLLDNLESYYNYSDLIFLNLKSGSLVWQTEPNTLNWDFSGKSRAQSCYTWNPKQLHNGHFSANSDPATSIHHISRRVLKKKLFSRPHVSIHQILFICLITSLLTLTFSVNHFLPGLPQRASRLCLLMDAMNGWKK